MSMFMHRSKMRRGTSSSTQPARQPGHLVQELLVRHGVVRVACGLVYLDRL